MTHNSLLLLFSNFDVDNFAARNSKIPRLSPPRPMSPSSFSSVPIHLPKPTLSTCVISLKCSVGTIFHLQLCIDVRIATKKLQTRHCIKYTIACKTGTHPTGILFKRNFLWKIGNYASGLNIYTQFEYLVTQHLILDFV